MQDEKTNGIRERFQSILNENLEQLTKDLQTLEPKDRIKVLLDISRFVLPTLKSVYSKDTLNAVSPISINDLYSFKD